MLKYRKRQVTAVNAQEVIQETAKLCRSFHAKEIILYGSRAKGTARERSDIDIAVSGVADFDALVEAVEDLPTLYSVDLLNLDTCRNQLLLEDIREYGRKI
ncbi:nucleotidyltransferase family protein [uncultured Clostridium sp.]|uniref:nucleotidyltransferase family protein n=1 Tax=uncultured Clostridium sp. TaxID=59620 RepID=UPI00258A0081|nr:nucleotidyltransferase domain-containing protein [uncultured Clostridium sp.]